MRTSHKLTRLVLALMTLVVLSTIALAQANVDLPNVAVSDQKAGSVLVWPYYTSTTVGQTKADTRLSMTNVSNTASVKVHVFLIDSATCSQADLFVCLTPNASASLKTSEYDPDKQGYAIAVAVNDSGFPYQANVLIGNAFVTDPTSISGNVYEGNYGAEAFRRTATAVNTNGQIKWGVDYDEVPYQFAVEVQHPTDVVGQRIVVAGLQGNISTGTSTGCAQLGTGQAYNQDEKFASFQNFLTGSCLCRQVINASAPRVPGGNLAALIGVAGQGRSGTLKFNVTSGVGLIMTPRIAAGQTNAWSGIRTLHKTATSTTSSDGSTTNGRTYLTIPVFIPVC
ncbi:MAG: hypothetical protein U0Y68_04935 [Blastocatellia bacterium]